MAQSAGAKASSFVVSAIRSIFGWWRWVLGLVVLAALVAGAYRAGLSWQHSFARAEALRLCQQGRFADAEPLLKRALAWQAADVDVVRALALGYLGSGNNQEAEAYLDRWCTL